LNKEAKAIKQIIITDGYGLKRYEVYLTPCKLSVLSYDHGRQLTDEEVKCDEDLLSLLRPLLSFKQRARG